MFNLLLMLVGLVAVGYAHFMLPRHTKNTTRTWLVRMMLIGTGLLFAGVGVTVYKAADGAAVIPAFLGLFGLVHIPAAAILYLKERRVKIGAESASRR